MADVFVTSITNQSIVNGITRFIDVAGITSQSINCLAKIENESVIDFPEQHLSKGFFAGLLKTASKKNETIVQEKSNWKTQNKQRAPGDE